MRLTLLCAALTVAVACAPDPVPNPPPRGQFYFPTGLAFEQGETDAGMLLVASSNFDKRFDRGRLTLVPLSQVPDFPALGAALDGGPPRVLVDLGAEVDVEIQSFAGEIGVTTTDQGFRRAFVASRAEGSPLQYVDIIDGTIGCDYASPEHPEDCFTNAPSLTEAEDTESGIPRAPSPSGLYATPGPSGAQVFVAHFQTADSPKNSAGTDLNKSRESYVVRTSASAPEIVESTTSEGSFIPIGLAPSSSIVATNRWLIVSGRFVNNGGPLIRLIQRDEPEAGGVRRVIDTNLDDAFRSLEARGLAVTRPDDPGSEKTIYLAAREPDELLVARMSGADTDAPTLRLIRALPLPANPNDVKIIERTDDDGRPREPLVVISCSGDDSIVIYDGEVGAVVQRVAGIGDQPYALAIQRLGNAARIFVTNFADSRVAVVDIADVAKPEPRIVAHLGQQICISNNDENISCEP